jgi:hypothetical protein
MVKRTEIDGVGAVAIWVDGKLVGKRVPGITTTDGLPGMVTIWVIGKLVGRLVTEMITGEYGKVEITLYEVFGRLVGIELDVTNGSVKRTEIDGVGAVAIWVDGKLVGKSVPGITTIDGLPGMVIIWVVGKLVGRLVIEIITGEYGKVETTLYEVLGRLDGIELDVTNGVLCLTEIGTLGNS